MICGYGGNDTLLGQGGDDTLLGGPGADALRGGPGRDVLRGEAGRDTLTGGEGPDALAGGAASDTLTGGAGADICARDTGDTRTEPCAVDAAAPVIGPLTAPVTVSAGSTLEVSWTVADAAGVASTTFFVGGTSGWVTWCGFGTPGTLVAGGLTSGTWSVSCPVPADAVNGSYSLWVTAQDVFGATSAPASDTDVVVVGGADDAEAPVVSGVVAPSAAAPGEAVELRWRLRDDTGVDRTIAWVAGPDGRFTDADGVLVVDYGDFTVDRVSGGPTDGVYRLVVTVPAGAVPGLYTLWFSAADTLGNRVFDTAVAGQDTPVTFEVG